MLNVFVGDTGSGSLKGLVPATISGDGVKYLKVMGHGVLLVAQHLVVEQ
jgi:hypothetical protein